MTMQWWRDINRAETREERSVGQLGNNFGAAQVAFGDSRDARREALVQDPNPSNTTSAQTLPRR
jgi:hypothetical protein